MEMALLQSHGPLSGRIRPTVAQFSPSLRFRQPAMLRLVPRMAASSEYSRRRQRKSAIPKTKVSAPKGFAPKPTVTRKKEQNDFDAKDGTLAAEFSEEVVNEEFDSGPSVVTVTTEALEGDEGMGYDAEKEKDGDLHVEIPSATIEGGDVDQGDSLDLGKPFVAVISSDEELEGGKSTYTDKNLADIELEAAADKAQSGGIASEPIIFVSTKDAETDTSEEVKKEEVLTQAQTGSIVAGKESGKTDGIKENGEVAVENVVSTAETNEVDQREKHIVTEESDIEELVVRQDTQMDMQARRQRLEALAEENLTSGSKMFVFPELVEADQVIEVFLNRSLSTLINECDVLIKGAYNGWRWKSFTEKMQKTELNGDWWSCSLNVPKEAYRIDFVFFSGGNVYENNGNKDFSILVNGEMNESSFEDFLLAEKQKELDRLAAEHAEKERQAEEQRRKDAERAAIEADKAQAKAEVDKKRESLRQVIKLAKSIGDVWYTEPTVFKGGDRVRIFYNRSSRNLAHAEEVWIHGGHNNWSEGLTIVERLFPSPEKVGDWWYADVDIPDGALVLDWVVADGPPQRAKVFDNNFSLDFHVLIPMSVPEELFWVEEEHRIYTKLQEERKSKEEALRRKAEKTAIMKAETRERTLNMFLLSQKNTVYTEPLYVRAGGIVSVFYNPSNTVLSGKPDVWFKCSFNRWTHRNGPLPSQKMLRAEDGSRFKITVKVPLDAYIMDFVFSEKEDGGIYDNKNGMDYHIPVAGGILKEPPMHIVHISVEMAPIAKVGGLGDVVTSLSRAVQDLGHNVDIILPKYDFMNLSNVKDFHYRQSFAWGGTEIKVWFGKVEGVSTYFLEPQNGMFCVGCIYGKNDVDRFGFFCHTALEFLLQKGSHPDIIHCHDWSSAPVSWLFKEHYMHCGLSNARVIFTIHNLEFGAHQIGKAMKYADKATTVSQTYSKEVSGNPLISPHLYKFHGIINGIDQDIWDPYNDNFIPVSYTSENVVEGKKAAKEALQQRLGLKKSDLPLVGIITRLTAQKGIHLIKHAIWQTLDRNGQIILLGTAPDPRIQNDFVNFANQLHSSHGDRVRLCLTYDEPLSHLIYAGSDFILVPSIFEPCGLTQLIAMRYGSIPVVRKTGGLCDTVFDVDNDKDRALAHGLEPNGFSFEGADSGGVDYALNRALSAWYESREWFNTLCKRAMEQDWSWNRPALDYMELYHAARK